MRALERGTTELTKPRIEGYVPQYRTKRSTHNPGRIRRLWGYLGAPVTGSRLKPIVGEARDALPGQADDASVANAVVHEPVREQRFMAALARD